MTLDELREQIAALAHLPGDTLVLVSSDAEGNQYSPLAEIDSDVMYVRDSFDWDTYPSNETVDAYPERYSDEDRPPEGAAPAIVLYPV
jgi:hypothetical protein